MPSLHPIDSSLIYIFILTTATYKHQTLVLLQQFLNRQIVHLIKPFRLLQLFSQSLPAAERPGQDGVSALDSTGEGYNPLPSCTLQPFDRQERESLREAAAAPKS